MLKLYHFFTYNIFHCLSENKLMKVLKFCRVCNSKKLINIISLGNLYLSDFRTDNKKPPKYPLDLVLCQKCFLLQLRHTTPASLLYTDNYGYKSGINKTMQDELKNIVLKSSSKLKNKTQLTVLDIGANDGTLLKYYPKTFYRVGIEPISKLAKEAKKYSNLIINDFFTYEAVNKAKKNIQADIITAVSCFYDIKDPNKFISDVKKILKEEGVFIIQQNYLAEMLSKNAFDNIVHEHLEYYSLLSLSNLLSRHNLEVFDVEIRNLNGGSFRTYIATKGKRKITNAVRKLEAKEKNLKLDNKNIYLEFTKRIKNNKLALVKFIKKQFKDGRKVYLYGASTRGNTLIQYFGLNNRYIHFAVERNPEKWGKKISSMQIPIISEAQARKDKPEFMLVLPWFFKEEFLERENEYLKNGGHFIFPLPELEII